jgi:hypothetical protein
MITRILTAMARQLDVGRDEPGHFHPGPRGPYPCHAPAGPAGRRSSGAGRRRRTTRS